MTQFRPSSFLATTALFIGLSLSTANADTLTADISESQIAITSNFTGKALVLFGAIDRTGKSLSEDNTGKGPSDVVVVIRGPDKNIMVRQKQRTAGIWANRQAVQFEKVPGYYFVAGNRDFEDIASDAVYRRNGIRASNLPMKPVFDVLQESDLDTYQTAIIRNKQRAELFHEEEGGVKFLDRTLFRTTVELPANVPVGVYSSKVYLIQNGQVVAVQSKPLYINKTGIERSIFEFADDSPFAYGVLAVLFAFLAGWLASIMFKQD